ncbi:unnamed protein product [Parascedosporium putredinis]|uniref:Uncharacterized protein n=1 Tax=Parascedosporium putredinis TaxID=1442378 RepID=A0A9P1GWK5_9PEZI|nr:unnamed protein product [Parascedosporium putredinis]CAI7988944.1 unnamed protein product [Parascedosporium putredinis]
MGRKRFHPVPVVATDTVIPLHSLDGNHINASILLYCLLRFDDVLDAEKLRAALQKLLDRDGWRKLGARLRINDTGKYEYHIPQAFNDSRPAFTYSHVNHGVPIAEHPAGSQVPSGQPVGDSPSILPAPPEIAKLASPADGPRTLADYVEHDRPQIGLHVVSFADATLVSISGLHTLWDAMGRKEFLLAWIAVLEGREDEVKPFSGFDEDPLRELGSQPSEPFDLVDRRLSMLQLLVYGLRHKFEQVAHDEDAGVICIPAKFLASLRDEAMAELDGFSARAVVKHTPIRSARTVTLFNALSLRGILADELLPSTDAYVANAISGINTILPARDIAERPLGYTAAKIRQTLGTQTTRDQQEACVALMKETFARTGYPALFGDATMQMVLMTNWSKAKFFDLDFSSAVVGRGDAVEIGGDDVARKPGRPTYVQPVSFSDFSTRYAFNVAGKDANGNYWLYGVLRKKTWARMAEALKRGEYC